MPAHFGPIAVASGKFGEPSGSPTRAPVATSTTWSVAELSCATSTRRPSPIGATPEGSITTSTRPSRRNGAGSVAVSSRQWWAQTAGENSPARPTATAAVRRGRVGRSRIGVNSSVVRAAGASVGPIFARHRSAETTSPPAMVPGPRRIGALESGFRISA